MSGHVTDFELGFLIAATIINSIFPVVICWNFWGTVFNAGWSGSEDSVPCNNVCCFSSPLLILGNIAIIVVLWVVTLPAAVFWCLIIIPLIYSIFGVLWSCYVSNQSYD